MEHIDVKIISSQTHNSQVLTGFWLLNQDNEYAVSIKDCRKDNPKYSHLAFVEAHYKDRVIIYDTLDGYHNIESMKYYLERCDYYFKRSFSKKLNQEFFPELQYKMYPLGMNYYVTYPKNPLDEHGLRKIAKSLLGIKNYSYYTHEKFECFPKVNSSPTVLFCTRLWAERNELSQKENEEIHEINKSRIELIDALRDTFGERFFGGLYDEVTARELAPRLIMDKSLTYRDRYLQRMKNSDICIATTGLHQSIGWKTAEYVAASRAIVSEPLHYELPGNFTEKRNYLQFLNKEECIKAVNELMKSPQKIYDIQIENRKYYIKYLEPSVFVKRTLKIH